MCEAILSFSEVRGTRTTSNPRRDGTGELEPSGPQSDARFLEGVLDWGMDESASPGELRLTWIRIVSVSASLTALRLGVVKVKAAALARSRASSLPMTIRVYSLTLRGFIDSLHRVPVHASTSLEAVDEEGVRSFRETGDDVLDDVEDAWVVAIRQGF